MASKSILLAVSDPQMSGEITQALGAAWEVTSVASEEEALAQFEKRSFDALLVDFNLGSPDGSDLLNLALEKHPDTVAFLLAHEADLALVAAKVAGSPHILPKPIEPVSLKRRIEDGVKESNDEQSGSEPANPPSAAPEIPPIYAEVLKALESPDVTVKQVGAIIARDAALSSEILSLTKSSYLGLPRDISDPVEAVETLGLEAVKAAVMALRYLAENSQLKPGYLSLDQIWQHSINVGQIARDLVLFETKDAALASQALIAGLLHDLGKVVLATNFGDLYGRVYSLARKQPVAIWDVEREMFGASHGEVGACLVGMWNVPSPVVDAVALHHEPPLGEHEQLDPLAAVHIANVLERELWLGGEDTVVAPVISSTFLNELGLLQRLPIWRAAFRNQKSVNLTPELEGAETDPLTTPQPRGASPLPSLVAVTRTRRSWEPQRGEGAPRTHSNWFYAVAAGILGLLVFWFMLEQNSKRSELVYARTQPAQAAPVAPAPAPEIAPVAPTEPAPSLPVPKPAVATAPAETAPAETVPETTTPAATATNDPLPSVATQPKPPGFRLNGIIYGTARPSAMVNGKTVYVGDQVDGATVVAIGPDIVTLLVDGQRKTYKLR
jgi:HD-like signal output (HDOD) protein/ActR/RegA family two-component response regulator